MYSTRQFRRVFKGRPKPRRLSNQLYSLDSQPLRVPGADQLFVIYPCRAGAIIKEIREASGAHIKILPAEELPPCGLSNDRVVQ